MAVAESTPRARSSARTWRVSQSSQIGPSLQPLLLQFMITASKNAFLNHDWRRLPSASPDTFFFDTGTERMEQRCPHGTDGPCAWCGLPHRAARRSLCAGCRHVQCAPRRRSFPSDARRRLVAFAGPCKRHVAAAASGPCCVQAFEAGVASLVTYGAADREGQDFDAQWFLNIVYGVQAPWCKALISKTLLLASA